MISLEKQKYWNSCDAGTSQSMTKKAVGTSAYPNKLLRRRGSEDVQSMAQNSTPLTLRKSLLT